MSFKFFGGGGGGGGTDLGDVLVVDSSVAEDGNGLYSTFGAAYTAAAAGDTIICYDSQTAFSESLTFNKTDLGVWAPSTTITGNVTIQQGLDFVFGTIGSNNTTAPLRILASSCRSVTVLGDLRNYSTALEAVLISNSDSTRVELRGRVDTGGSAELCCVRQFPIRLEVAGLVCVVFQDNVTLGILEVPEPNLVYFDCFLHQHPLAYFF